MTRIGELAVNGRTILYCLYGMEGGVPVVAHHGTPGSRWERPDVVKAIEDTGLQVLLFGRAGYGSSRQPGRQVADVAADVEVLVDDLGWDRFAVTGFSGGGPHALATAVLMPGRVTRCSTVSGIAPPGTQAFESLSWFPEAQRGELFLADHLAARGREILSTFEPDSGGYERMRAACVDGLYGWVDDYLALSRPWGFAPGEVRVPVDVWFGSLDDNSTPDHAAWLSSELPTSTARAYEGGHDPDDEVQRRIFAALR